MIPHVVVCLAYQRERIAYQNSSSNPYIVVQWCSDTISEMTTLVISLMVSLHQCTTIRGLMTNYGMQSFLVSTQDIRTMRYHNVSFMSQSCLHLLFMQSLNSFSNFLKIIYLLVSSFFLLLMSIFSVFIIIVKRWATKRYTTQ